MSDVRYALRSLRNSPVSSAVIVVLLAVGICSNTVIFSVIDPLLLRPLPVRQPQELVQFMEVRAITFPEFSPGFFKLLREHSPEALSEVGYEGELDVWQMGETSSALCRRGVAKLLRFRSESARCTATYRHR
jgi:hypothetical protein